MTTRRMLQVVGVVALVTWPSHLSAQDGVTPPAVTPRVIHSDVAEILPSYANLEDRIRQADAVIRGRVLGAGQPVVPAGIEPGRGVPVSTEFLIQTLAVYKPHQDADSVGTVVHVMQTGGEARVGDVIMRTTSGTHLLVDGAEFLLFLKYEDRRHRFWTVTTDTFPIIDGRIKVDILHAQPFARELDGVSSSDSPDALWTAVRAAAAAPTERAGPTTPPPPPPPLP